MTAQEKQMKKYCNAVERRLNLPRELKARVMADFTSSITARREAGMTDEEIFAELGSPKKAASDLNAQMADYTYRKSPWRFAFLALAVYGLYQLAMEALAWYVMRYMSGGFSYSADPAAVGIIGGADGPTAIFVTATVATGPQVLMTLICLAAGIWGYRYFSRRKKK